MKLSDLPTPCLVLDRARLDRNIARMRERARSLGVDLRPHLKTAKSAEVARRATAGFSGSITVSTLAEARHFAASGFRDLTYAVGIVPSKLPEIARLIREGTRVTSITDDVAVACEVAAAGARLGVRFPVLIEIDTGGGRAGIDAQSPVLIEIARALSAPGAECAGVLTHAGHSYHCHSRAEIARIAEEERSGAVRAAARLREAGFPAPVVSVGSTPTALFAERLDGVSEMRPGNFVFFDLFQSGLGTCSEDDIAVSVLASVVGHHRGRNHLLIDAGGLALSKDVGANEHREGIGYGLIGDLEGARPIEGLAVLDVHQEHGIVGAPKGLDAIAPLPFARFPVGGRMRVLPNHSCMTAAAFDRYAVVDGGEAVVAEWPRVNGW